MSNLIKLLGLGFFLAASDPVLAQTVEYIHTDALGSPIAVTNAVGEIVETHVYEPYGANLGRELDDEPAFTGHLEDSSTGLTYMQQRYYDPVVGLFLSTDPVTVDGSVGNNFNRYWYGNNNPYTYTDAQGMCTGSHIANQDGTCAGSGDFLSNGFGPTMLGAQTVVHQAAIEGQLGFNASSAVAVELPSLPQGLVDGAAGFGDALSFGGSRWVREGMGVGSVDYDSGAYTAGEVGGVAYGLALGGVGGLSGGARSVFWSGAGNQERAAALGRSLESTPVGALMNRFGSKIPYWAWKAASNIYARNASGMAIKVGLQEGNIWATIERPILAQRGIPIIFIP